MAEPAPILVNDVHSQLNPTSVRGIVVPDSPEALQAIVQTSCRERRPLCIAGARHAMGTQQFATGALLLDMRKLNQVVRFDPVAGTVKAEAGIQWPELIAYLVRVQQGCPSPWGIAQKQTGADRLTLGGAVAANIHGRGLRMKPLIGDVQSLVLLDAQGELRTCSRQENPDLFRLAVGGYGLFGVIVSVTLRLIPRQKVERIVEIIRVEDLLSAYERRIAEGCLYGDFQFATAAESEDFLTTGVFACYRPVDPATPFPVAQKTLRMEDWMRLVFLAHTDKRRAFDEYAAYYRSTAGQVYWTDTHQLGVYRDGYHQDLDRRLGAQVPATEMITELFVPRQELTGFLGEVRQDFRDNDVDLIYGTIRLIEPDEESFLQWARAPYAGTIFNLHTMHTPEGLERSKRTFRRLIDLAVRHGGTYFLTYHRYATREQVATCYPQFPEFLGLKKVYDPGEIFQSDWYRHYKMLFGA